MNKDQNVKIKNRTKDVRLQDMVRIKDQTFKTKAAISRKRVKIEEKLLWTAYRKSLTLFQTVPAPTPMASPSSILGGCNLATPSYVRNW